jgi:hypothetical protein
MKLNSIDLLEAGSRTLLFQRGHHFDFFQFDPFETKEGGHLNDLILIYEIFSIGAEFFYHGIEVAATHRGGNIVTRSTLALRIVQTEFTNDHLPIPSPRISRSRETSGNSDRKLFARYLPRSFHETANKFVGRLNLRTTGVRSKA